MGYELSREVLRAAQLSDDLRESEERMTLAAEAAGFGVWMWNIARNQVWGSERWLRLFGFAPGASVSLRRVIQRIHPDDREMVEREVRRALADGCDYAGEYRVVLPDGAERWIVARGRMQSGRARASRRGCWARPSTSPRASRRSWRSSEQRNELTHLSRVTMLGELSGSLAHELNQPLTAILSNAQAAQRFLAETASISTRCATF